MMDVARLCGVHQTTVSRALRKDPRITLAVQTKVQAAAEKLGYKPNPLLSALGTLRRQRSTSRYQAVIAYILREGYETRHLRGIQATAEQRGYKVEIFRIGKNLPEARLNNILIARNIQGLILGPLPEAHGRFQLDWERFATVVIEYSFTNPAFDRVVTDSYSSMNLAISECRKRGYTRIGLLLAQIVDERNEGLLCAAYALQKERDPEMAPLTPLILSGFDEKQCESWFRAQKPQVLITSNIMMRELEAFFKRRSLHVPRKLGLVNLNTFPDHQPYSGICQNSPAIGAAAARIVIEKMNHNEYGIPESRVTILTEPLWVNGRTLQASFTR